MVPNMVPGLRLSDTDFGDEVSVHDYISVHRAGVALHRGSARCKEEKSNAAEKHDQIVPETTTKNLFGEGKFAKKRVKLEGCGCSRAAEEDQYSSRTDV